MHGLSFDGANDESVEDTVDLIPAPRNIDLHSRLPPGYALDPAQGVLVPTQEVGAHVHFGGHGAVEEATTQQLFDAEGQSDDGISAVPATTEQIRIYLDASEKHPDRTSVVGSSRQQHSQPSSTGKKRDDCSEVTNSVRYQQSQPAGSGRDSKDHSSVVMPTQSQHSQSVGSGARYSTTVDPNRHQPPPSVGSGRAHSTAMHTRSQHSQLSGSNGKRGDRASVIHRTQSSDHGDMENRKEGLKATEGDTHPGTPGNPRRVENPSGVTQEIERDTGYHVSDSQTGRNDMQRDHGLGSTSNQQQGKPQSRAPSHSFVIHQPTPQRPVTGLDGWDAGTTPDLGKDQHAYNQILHGPLPEPLSVPLHSIEHAKLWIQRVSQEIENLELVSGALIKRYNRMQDEGVVNGTEAFHHWGNAWLANEAELAKFGSARDQLAAYVADNEAKNATPKPAERGASYQLRQPGALTDLQAAGEGVLKQGAPLGQGWNLPEHQQTPSRTDKRARETKQDEWNTGTPHKQRTSEPKQYDWNEGTQRPEFQKAAVQSVGYSAKNKALSDRKGNDQQDNGWKSVPSHRNGSARDDDRKSNAAKSDGFPAWEDKGPKQSTSNRDWAHGDGGWDTHSQDRKHAKSAGPMSEGWTMRTQVPNAHVKPYWADWQKQATPFESSEQMSKKKREGPRQVYEYPPTPLPAVPADKAHGATHAVATGKGAIYTHKVFRPVYLDTIEAPYAVFSFKYRNKSELERILGKSIGDDVKQLTAQVKKEQLMSMPKHKLIEQLMNARGPQSAPSASASHRGGSGWGGSAANKDTKAADGWGGSVASKDRKSADGWGGSAAKNNGKAASGWGGASAAKSDGKAANGWGGASANGWGQDQGGNANGWGKDQGGNANGWGAPANDRGNQSVRGGSTRNKSMQDASPIGNWLQDQGNNEAWNNGGRNYAWAGTANGNNINGQYNPGGSQAGGRQAVNDGQVPVARWNTGTPALGGKWDGAIAAAAMGNTPVLQAATPAMPHTPVPEGGYALPARRPPLRAGRVATPAMRNTPGQAGNVAIPPVHNTPTPGGAYALPEVHYTPVKAPTPKVHFPPAADVEIPIPEMPLPQQHQPPAPPMTPEHNLSNLQPANPTPRTRRAPSARGSSMANSIATGFDREESIPSDMRSLVERCVAQAAEDAKEKAKGKSPGGNLMAKYENGAPLPEGPEGW